jgi:peroxiredoxin
MASSKQNRMVEAGGRAPDFLLRRLEGGEVALRGLLEGGPVLLVFFKISCPVCQFTLPYLERLHQGGVRVFGISQNDAEDTREFNREFAITLPMLLDEEDGGFPASNAYGISHVPAMFLVKPDGSIARAIDGWQRKEIEWLGSETGVLAIRQGERVPEWKSG